MKKFYEVRFENSKGWDLTKEFEARCWNDAVDAFRKWASSNEPKGYKLIGVKGIHY